MPIVSSRDIYEWNLSIEGADNKKQISLINQRILIKV